MCVVGNTNTAVYYLTVYNYHMKLENYKQEQILYTAFR